NWVIQTTPNPAGATSSQLSGMSCSSATACTAAGSYTNGTGTEVTLAERWDGTNWAIQTTPNPAGATSSQLNGVSCSSSTACSAAGNYTNATATDVTLAEALQPGWKLQTTPNVGGLVTTTRLIAVSCPSPTACMAVGFFIGAAGNPLALAERWDGTAWTLQTF